MVGASEAAESSATEEFVLAGWSHAPSTAGLKHCLGHVFLPVLELALARRGTRDIRASWQPAAVVQTEQSESFIWGFKKGEEKEANFEGQYGAGTQRIRSLIQFEEQWR